MNNEKSGAIIIRPYKPEDIPRLTRLWIDVFKDDKKYVDEFFRLLPQIGSGVVAAERLSMGERGWKEKILGAAYALDGLKYTEKDGSEKSLAYIYAVAVDENYRHFGLGGGLTKAAKSCAENKGISIISTLPAELSLYPWYESLIGTNFRIYRKASHFDISSASDSGLDISRICPKEYEPLRRSLLRGKTYVSLSLPSLELEEIMLATYGGGLFALWDKITGAPLACAGAYMDGDRAVIKELICPDNYIPAAVGALAVKLNASCGEYYLPSNKENGEAYVAFNTPIDENCIWNLSFD